MNIQSNIRKSLFLLFIAAICGCSFLSLNVNTVSANNVNSYKKALRSGFDKYDKDNVEYYKATQRSNGLFIKITPPDRQIIDGGLGYYTFEAIRAINKTNLNPTVQTVTFKNEDDKVTFNITDLKNISFKEKDVRSNAKQYNDGEDNDNKYSYYLQDVVYPKAISHTSCSKDN